MLTFCPKHKVKGMDTLFGMLGQTKVLNYIPIE